MTRTFSARRYRGTRRNVVMLAKKLRGGELVAVPTETVYGLAANAFDAAAAKRIFQVKGRPANDPLIVHVHRHEQLAEICRLNRSALKLARAFWPGPLTLVLPKQPRVPLVVTAGRPSVAVRMPAHALFRRLLEAVDLPLAAPSANRFGYVSPTTAQHVYDGLGDRIRHILDGGPAKIGVESTIVDLRDPRRPRLLRPGAITREEMERVLGQKIAIRRLAAPSASKRAGAIAPGMLARHYSPRTPVVLHKKISRTDDARAAYVFLQRPRLSARNNVFWLDRGGDLKGAARRLFGMLRSLDRRGFTMLHIELASEAGLGVAINDRLRRAAAR